MAEIKSTMDLVMERAARMGKASSAEIEEDAAKKLGMQLAGTYLNEEDSSSLASLLGEQNQAMQRTIEKGMLSALFRNIFLPRDDISQQRNMRALAGILELGKKAKDLASVCKEIGHITGQYTQHRQQLREQLEAQMRMQYEQALAQQTGMPADGLNIDPTMLPQFKEEWKRVEGELDGQYNQALDQHKTLLGQRLGV